MGYSTDFSGGCDITPALSPEHVAYLQAFNRSRRVKRDPALCRAILRESEAGAGCLLINGTDLPVENEGEYFIGLGTLGQIQEFSIIDYNTPPSTQPGLWCGWTVTSDGTALIWDGSEKFYDYVEWLQYVIEHFMKRWGYTLNGMIDWHGEDSDDRGTIYVKDNRVEAIDAEIHVGRPSWES